MPESVLKKIRSFVVGIRRKPDVLRDPVAPRKPAAACTTELPGTARLKDAGKCPIHRHKSLTGTTLVK